MHLILSRYAENVRTLKRRLELDPEGPPERMFAQHVEYAARVNDRADEDNRLRLGAVDAGAPELDYVYHKNDEGE
jgi:hypothetical protein